MILQKDLAKIMADYVFEAKQKKNPQWEKGKEDVNF